jgi:hypothetical protein
VAVPETGKKVLDVDVKRLEYDDCTFDCTGILGGLACILPVSSVVLVDIPALV